MENYKRLEYSTFYITKYILNFPLYILEAKSLNNLSAKNIEPLSGRIHKDYKMSCYRCSADNCPNHS